MHIVSKVVKEFPDIFRSLRANANLNKYGRWWKKRAHIMASIDIDDFLSLSHTHIGLRKCVELKCARGRGRKATQWKTWIYPIVLEEFERLKAIGL